MSYTCLAVSLKTIGERERKKESDTTSISAVAQYDKCDRGCDKQKDFTPVGTIVGFVWHESYCLFVCLHIYVLDNDAGIEKGAQTESEIAKQ